MHLNCNRIAEGGFTIKSQCLDSECSSIFDTALVGIIMSAFLINRHTILKQGYLFCILYAPIDSNGLVTTFVKFGFGSSNSYGW